MSSRWFTKLAITAVAAATITTSIAPIASARGRLQAWDWVNDRGTIEVDQGVPLRYVDCRHDDKVTSVKNNIGETYYGMSWSIVPNVAIRLEIFYQGDTIAHLDSASNNQIDHFDRARR